MKEIFKDRPYPKWGLEFEIGCSNDGEDNFVINYFRNKDCNKIVVDIGAADGITGSNSYRLIDELGWSAILIEPLQSFYEYLLKLHENNQNVEILNYACDNEEKQTTIKYRNFDEAIGLSSLINEWENSQSITTKKFNNLVNIKQIDFLSIDCEGKDLDIIKDIDFNEYTITIICCEKSDDNNHNSNIIDYLTIKGYNLVITTEHNFIFVKK